MRLSNFTFTFHFHALEKKMATHSSVLAWRIPETAEPGGLPSMGWHRVGQADKTWQLSSNIYRAPNICQISCRALNVLSHLVLKTTLIWLVPQNVLQTGRLRFREANPWIHSQFFFFFAFYTLIIIGYFKSNLWVIYIYTYIYIYKTNRIFICGYKIILWSRRSERATLCKLWYYICQENNS